jgi:ribosomal protein L18E
LPKIPVVVRARSFSKDAERRIKAVGGFCVRQAKKEKKKAPESK